MNIGSLDSLNPSVRCGLSSKACQIRPIVDAESPDFSAMDRRDQWVAFFGVDSRVSTTIFSTCSAVIDGTRPGRGSSSRPSNRSSRKRLRHFPIVGCETPNRAATSLFGTPSAHSRTIRDRSAKACADDRRRAHRCNCSRSSEVNSSNAFGRPVRTMPNPTIYVALQWRGPLGADPAHVVVLLHGGGVQGFGGDGHVGAGAGLEELDDAVQEFALPVGHVGDLVEPVGDVRASGRSPAGKWRTSLAVRSYVAVECTAMVRIASSAHQVLNSSFRKGSGSAPTWPSISWRSRVDFHVVH